MECIALILAYVFSVFLAYFIIKANFHFLWKSLINFLLLLAFGCTMILSGIKETSLLIYIILLAQTLLGILMRIIAPLVLNITGSLLSRILKQHYTWQTYDQLMQAEYSGNKMYFCVHLFTTTKIFFSIIFVASCFNLIK